LKQHFILYLAIAFILSACAPTNYTYIKKNYDLGNYKISEVLVAVEYLNLKETLTGSWIFNENTNLSNQDRIYGIVVEMLENKGYTIANQSLKTSGLILNRNILAKHYYNEKLQELPISPPFIIRSIDIDEATIQGLEVLLAEINKPVSHVMSDYKSFINNNFKPQMQSINIDDNVAILLIQSFKPKNTIFSSFDVGFGVSSSSSAVFASTDNVTYKPTSYAYLIHKGTGELLWSNKISEIKSKNQLKFFEKFPIKL